MGAATNLIDFTTDINVAIYFAAEEEWSRDGRVILIRATDYAAWRLDAKTPPHRASAQKSVFIRHPHGVVKPWRQVPVRAADKLAILTDLGSLAEPITTWKMYNDIYGYIRLSQRYVEGMDAYHEALALLDEYNRARGQGRTPQKLIEKAKTLQRIAIEKLYWTGGVWAEVARAHFCAGEYDDAATMAHRALELGLRSPDLYGMLGTIAQIRGNAEAAEKHAKTGMELCDSSPSSTAQERTRAKLDVVAMNAQVLLGRMADAKASFRRALDANENCPLSDDERRRMSELFEYFTGA